MQRPPGRHLGTRSRESLKNSVIGSVAFHVLLLLLFLTWMRFHSPLDLVAPPKSQSEFVDVKLVAKAESKPKTILIPGPGLPHTSPSAQTQRKSTPLSLGLVARAHPANPENGRSGESRGGFEEASSIDLTQDAELYAFFRALWKNINSTTGYPNELVLERVQGQVTIQVEVDGQGRFTGKFLEARSQDELLKTYVIAALIQSLRDPLPEKNWIKKKRLSIVTRFDFEVMGHGEREQTQDEDHFKNILYFKRRAFAESKLYEFITKLYRRYIPPVLPLPGGVTIDFIQAYEMIRSIGKPDPEDVRKVHMEQDREKWLQVIKTDPGS